MSTASDIKAGATLREQDEAVYSRFDRNVALRLWHFMRGQRAATLLVLLTVLLYTGVQVAIPLAVRHAVDGALGNSRFGFEAVLLVFALLVLLTVLLYTGVQVAIPLAVRHAVDGALGNSRFGFEAVLLVFALLVVLNAGLTFLQEWLAARLAQTVIFDLRRAMFEHLQRVSLAVLDGTQVGRLMARLQGDVNALQEFMETSVTALADLFLLLGIVVLLLVLDWQLGLLTLCVLPALLILRRAWLPWARQAFTRARSASSTVNAALAENINGIRTVQETRREGVNFARYEEKARANFEAQKGSALVSQVMIPTVDALTGVAMAIVVVVGGAAVVQGRLEVGVIVAFIYCVQRFFDPIRTLAMQYTVMQRAMASGQRIFEVLDVPVTLADRETARALEEVLPDGAPGITLSGVVFGYRPGEPVLHGLDLQIRPGQTVALVGPTGSGKSSVAALVHRFYDVWQGAVSIGGADVRDLSQESLGRAVGMVLQEPFLFSGSVEDNVRYGAPDASRAQVVAACKAVHAHDFIEALPAGYDTQLGQRGRNLSVGQRQLLSFARALLAEPRVLILDEATASIDSFTELEIQRALALLRRGRTTIIIAHRLATIRDADQIVVLDRGRIVERGTHDELLTAGGMYATLHASGSASFDD